jgi:hypothetical protein
MLRALWLHRVRRWLSGRPTTIRRRPWLALEGLEERLTPTNLFYATDTRDLYSGSGNSGTLIYCIDQANAAGGGVIYLNAGATYDLTTPDNYWYGPNGLPAISSPVSIVGQGATIDRNPFATPFRLFFVSGGQDGLSKGNLLLDDVELRGGLA